jgi:hypothetical protein
MFIILLPTESEHENTLAAGGVAGLPKLIQQDILTWLPPEGIAATGILAYCPVPDGLNVIAPPPLVVNVGEATNVAVLPLPLKSLQDELVRDQDTLASSSASELYITVTLSDPTVVVVPLQLVSDIVYTFGYRRIITPSDPSPPVPVPPEPPPPLPYPVALPPFPVTDPLLITNY